MAGRGGIPGARFTMTPDPDSCGRPRRGFRQQTPGEVPPGQNAPAAVSVRSARGGVRHTEERSSAEVISVDRSRLPLMVLRCLWGAALYRLRHG